MVKFEKLSADAITKSKKHMILTIVFCVLLVIVLIFSRFVAVSSKTLAKQETELRATLASTEEVKRSTEAYQNTLKSMSLKPSQITNKEDLVIALGECANAAGCEITGLSSKSIQQEKSITKMNFTFEIKGSLKQIANVLTALDAKDIHYSVNELSLRQAADYIWLQRDITSDLSWLDSQYLGTSGSKQELSREEILSDSTMKFYLDVNFIIISELL